MGKPKGKRPCPACGSTRYAHSKWKHGWIVSCSDCPPPPAAPEQQPLIKVRLAPGDHVLKAAKTSWPAAETALTDPSARLQYVRDLKDQPRRQR